MKSYEEMLREARGKISTNTTKESRIQIPEPMVTIQGNRTFITNFTNIADAMRRDPKHLAKFLFRELAKPGHIEGSTLILQGRIIRSLLEKKIKAYMKEFLYCKECKSPDTRLEKEGRLIFLKCEACGAKQAVRKI